jgi:signal transduction histidine kinase
LIDNALKYTPEKRCIFVSVTRTAGNAVLSVSDTGAGFTEEERRHLFDRFYRANGDTAKRAPGSGLGLSIARAIVLAYDGEIYAESEGLGLGSRFTVMLAIAESHVATADVEEASHVD